MQEEPTVISAARIGYLFKIDPLIPLLDPDPFNWSVRIAQANLIARELEEARKKQK